MLAPFRCDVAGKNNERQIVRRQRNYVVALKGLNTINTFSCSAVTCLLIVTSENFWRDVVWHDVATSRHTISILPFLELAYR